jgi:hypothetical protein
VNNIPVEGPTFKEKLNEIVLKMAVEFHCFNNLSICVITWQIIIDKGSAADVEASGQWCKNVLDYTVLPPAWISSARI